MIVVPIIEYIIIIPRVGILFYTKLVLLFFSIAMQIWSYLIDRETGQCIKIKIEFQKCIEQSIIIK
jgi:hypothetical protein